MISVTSGQRWPLRECDRGIPARPPGTFRLSSRLPPQLGNNGHARCVAVARLGGSVTFARRAAVRRRGRIPRARGEREDQEHLRRHEGIVEGVVRTGDRHPVSGRAGRQRILRSFAQVSPAPVDADRQLSNVDGASPKSASPSLEHPAEEDDLDGRIPRQDETPIERHPQRSPGIGGGGRARRVLAACAVDHRGGRRRDHRFHELMDRCSHRDAPGANRHDAEGHDLVVQVVEAGRLEIERGERGRPPRAASEASTWRARKLGGHTHLRWVKAELEGGECALNAADHSERRLDALPRHEPGLLRIDVVDGRLPSSSGCRREGSCVRSFRTSTQASIVAASRIRNPHVLPLSARPNSPV